MDEWQTTDLDRVAQIAAAAVSGHSDMPPDRSFSWSLPDQFSQQWIDDLILRAHCTKPIWSDYALVEHRPSTWEIAGAFMDSEGRMPFVADDSAIIVAASSVELLVTVSAVPVSQEMRYQIGLHLLTVNPDTISAAISFRSFVCSYGLLQYPDSHLIDNLSVGLTGDRENSYLFNEYRTRLVFLFPRSGNLTRRARELREMAMFALSAFGVVIVNDAMYRVYRRKLKNSPFDILAIAPGGEAWPITRDEIGHLSGLANILEVSSLMPEVEPTITELSFSKAHWLRAGLPITSLEERRRAGLSIQQRWAELLPALNKRIAPPETPDEGFADPDPAEDIGTRELPLDEDGYPVSAGDIGPWVDLKFRNKILLLPRARRELSKVRHPEPRRIAQALELLAGPKLRGYRGEPGTLPQFDSGLIRLRMRDGFSNAQYLRGQTGDSYVFQYNGRQMFLERHLCSNASGFNDLKMIRIYYVYDRATRKIIVGWLPTHLPTTQS